MTDPIAASGPAPGNPAPAASDAATPPMPPRLRATVELFTGITDRNERIQALIDIAKGFRDVPPHIATRPFDPAHRVPHCESDVYIWAEPNPDSTLAFHFAVENPQGIAARAAASILKRGLDGQPLETVAAVPPDIMYDIFGRELSMGKNMGLTAMVNTVRALATRELNRRAGQPAAG